MCSVWGSLRTSLRTTALKNLSMDGRAIFFFYMCGTYSMFKETPHNIKVPFINWQKIFVLCESSLTWTHSFWHRFIRVYGTCCLAHLMEQHWHSREIHLPAKLAQNSTILQYRMHEYFQLSSVQLSETSPKVYYDHEADRLAILHTLHWKMANGACVLSAFSDICGMLLIWGGSLHFVCFTFNFNFNSYICLQEVWSPL